MIDALLIGETLAAIRSESVAPLAIGSPLRLSIAGAESNVAIGLARLGHRVRWVGCVGSDPLGALVVRTLRSEGIDTEGIRSVTDAPTALLLRHERLAALGQVSYYRTHSAGSRLDPDLVVAAMSEFPHVLHVSGITPALSPTAQAAVEAAMTTAGDADSHVSLDVNFRKTLWTREEATRVMRRLAQLADTVFASEDELSLVLPEQSDDDPSTLATDGRTVVIKRGSRGAAVVTPDASHTQPAMAVRVVDTVGAGDAFVAGYLSALLDGLDPSERLQRGTATAAFAVSTHGDWEGLPTRDELPLLDYGPDVTLR